VRVKLKEVYAMFAQNSQRHMQAGEMLDAECRKLNTENRHGTSAHIL